MSRIRERPPFRIGHGYDVHRFANDRPLVLCGITIPHDRGLEGHSDADCASHALADAILGAVGLPDIGCYFPNSDPALRGINSQTILARALVEANSRGYSIVNTDITIIAEEPKLALFYESMKHMLGTTLGIPAENIGLKSTTHEGLGALGSREGIAAHAVVLMAAEI